MTRYEEIMVIGLLLSSVSISSCTAKDPLYCDERTLCRKGYICNISNHTCEVARDSGTDGAIFDGKNIHPDTANDLAEQDRSRPDINPDKYKRELGGDTTHADLVGGVKCGDGNISGSEQCDGTNMGGKTCASQGFNGGTLKCTKACNFDTANCYKCGDGAINSQYESCDGSNLAGKTCKQTARLLRRYPQMQIRLPWIRYHTLSRLRQWYC